MGCGGTERPSQGGGQGAAARPPAGRYAKSAGSRVIQCQAEACWYEYKEAVGKGTLISASRWNSSWHGEQNMEPHSRDSRVSSVRGCGFCCE